VVVQGQNATFNATASGDVPLGYQWRLSGAPVNGASGSSYTVAGAAPANAGTYDVVVTNAYGSITSTVAQLTVLVPPTITAQPTNQTVPAGSSANFQVSATGTSPLNFQWWFNGTNSIGANTNVLTVGNAQPNQAGAYSVVITNAAGSVTSAVALLTIATPPSITQQPSNLVVVQGQNATFSVGASGYAPLNYQWRLNGAAIASTTSTSFTLIGATTTNAGNYDVVVSNPYGSATSTVAQLTVLQPPLITSQPTNQNVAVSGSVTFQVAASGTATLNYQWWFNGTNAVGTNGNTLNLSAVQTSQAGGYTVVVTNSAGSVTSTVATLTVGVPPAITQQPASLKVGQGQNASFNVASSGSAPVSYQWRFNGTTITGATSSSYSVLGATVSNGGAYDAIASNSYGSITSAVAQLTVLVPPTITNQPTNQTVPAGSTVNFQVAASGTAALSYQWWFNGTNAVGSDTNVLTLSNVLSAQAGAYSVVAANGIGSATSSVAMLTVLLPPTITTQPTNQTVMVGANVSFYASATGTGPLAYQWSFMGTPLTGASTSSLSLTNVQAAEAGSYAVAVTNSVGSATSATATLKVLVSPSITSPGVTGSSFSLQVPTTTGLGYLLEYKDTLQDASWTAINSWVPGNGTTLVLQDTNTITASRFYRVRAQ
jgi:hypothetical protein